MKIWEEINARAEIFGLNISKMLTSVDIEPSLPPIPGKNPDEYGGDIETIALSIRQYWMIPRGPVLNLTNIVEDTGAIVIPFDFGTRLIDGFSQHANSNRPPLIFINSGQPLDRFRFTLAHEIGHLVMHRLPNEMMEQQAHKFAAAFLMPKDDILPHLNGLSLKKLMSLKLRWRVSMAALLRRAKDLGKVTESTYRYYIMQMKKKGYWEQEPVGIAEDIENPTTLKQLINVHTQQLSYTPEELSNLFGMKVEEVDRLYLPQKRPRLRLVKSGRKRG